MGAGGFAWSSSPDSATSMLGAYLGFYSSDVGPENYYYRSRGYPVRCVQE